MALPYVVQAATGNPGLAYIPLADYLTNQLGFSAAQLAGFQAAVLLPWVTKPLWAMLIDGWARLGDRTKVGLVICFSLIVAGFGLLSLVPQPTVSCLLVSLSLLSVTVAVSDVVADRWMVIEGQRHQRQNVYQAAQWVGWGFTAVAMFLAGGWLADRTPLHQVFGLSAVVPALSLLLVAWRLPGIAGDAQGPTIGHRSQLRSQGSGRSQGLGEPAKENWVRDNSPCTQTKSCHESIVYPESMARAY
ncbi:MAG: hypothetical protein WBA99_06150 [Nodosilinea sp.]